MIEMITKRMMDGIQNWLRLFLQRIAWSLLLATLAAQAHAETAPASARPAPVLSRALDAVLMPIDDDTRSRFALADEQTGALVLAVAPGGLADIYGISPGDTISEISGLSFAWPDEIDAIVWAFLNQRIFEFQWTFMHQGAEQEITFPLVPAHFTESYLVDDIGGWRTWDRWSAHSSESWAAFIGRYTSSFAEVFEGPPVCRSCGSSAAGVATPEGAQPDAALQLPTPAIPTASPATAALSDPAESADARLASEIEGASGGEGAASAPIMDAAAQQTGIGGSDAIVGGSEPMVPPKLGNQAPGEPPLANVVPQDTDPRPATPDANFVLGSTPLMPEGMAGEAPPESGRFVLEQTLGDEVQLARLPRARPDSAAAPDAFGGVVAPPASAPLQPAVDAVDTGGAVDSVPLPAGDGSDVVMVPLESLPAFSDSTSAAILQAPMEAPAVVDDYMRDKGVPVGHLDRVRPPVPTDPAYCESHILTCRLREDGYE